MSVDESVTHTCENHAPSAGSPLLVNLQEFLAGQVVARRHILSHGGLDEPVGQGEARLERDRLGDLEI